MTRRAAFAALLPLLFAAAIAGTASAPVLAAETPDSKGTDFWLTFPRNYVDTPTLTLFITGDVTTTGTVSVPGLGFSMPFNVAENTVTTVSVPAGAQLATSGTVETKGIHVVAADEVTVYGLNRIQWTTDAYLGLPTDILGTEYIVLGYTTGWGSEFAVVGTVNGTTVTITPSASISGVGSGAGVPYTVTLNQGETYQGVNETVGSDLSGTIVTADQPIAVFGGGVCATVPPGYAACDHLVEQMTPVAAWGKTFVTVPLATRENGDTFRFLASADGTSVSVNGTVVATLDRGQLHEKLIVGAAQVTSDKPILVAQYSNGTEFDGVTSDPFEMLIPPYEQFLSGYTLTTPATGFTGNFINVAAPTSAVGSILLDGAAIPAGSFTAIGGSGFSGAQVSVALGSHTLSGAAPFGAFMYGFADYDSYGYPGGMSLAPVATVTTVALAPETATNTVGTQHCVVATVTDQEANPVSGVRVDFAVTGVNPTTGFETTGESGQATFCYTGTNPGSDTITGTVGTVYGTAQKTWEEAPTVTTVALAPKTATNTVGTQHCVVATVTDQHGSPMSSVQVGFTVTGVNPTTGFETTDESGQATFCYTGMSPGNDTITGTVGTLSDTAQKVWQAASQGCTRSQGYWKNHPGSWPVTSLMLGSVSYTQPQLLSILHTPAGRSPGLLPLAYQLIAAKLNAAAGAQVPAGVASAIAGADALIGSMVVPPIGNGSLKPAMASPFTGVLDTYNNGAYPGGPGYCVE
jgi:hypothetical protein